MNENLIAQLETEHARLLTEAGAIKTAITALRGPKAPSAPIGQKKAVKAKGRAPKGALEDAMTKAIKAKPGMTNGEVRAALAKNGYRWSLRPLYVGKRLSLLVEKGELDVKHDGNKRRYHPAK